MIAAYAILLATVVQEPDWVEPECRLLEYILSEAAESRGPIYFVRDYARYNISFSEFLDELGQRQIERADYLTPAEKAVLFNEEWVAAFERLPLGLIESAHRAQTDPGENPCDRSANDLTQWISRERAQALHRDALRNDLAGGLQTPSHFRTDVPVTIRLSEPAFDRFYTRALIRIGPDFGPAPWDSASACFGAYILFERTRNSWRETARLIDGCVF